MIFDSFRQQREHCQTLKIPKPLKINEPTNEPEVPASIWDVSRVTVAKIETGVRAANDGEIVVLAAVLKCTPGKLIDAIKVVQAVAVVRQGATAK